MLSSDNLLIHYLESQPNSQVFKSFERENKEKEEEKSNWAGLPLIGKVGNFSLIERNSFEFTSSR